MAWKVFVVFADGKQATIRDLASETEAMNWAGMVVSRGHVENRQIIPPSQITKVWWKEEAAAKKVAKKKR